MSVSQSVSCQAFSEQRSAIAGRFARRSLIQIKKPAPAMRLMAFMNPKTQPKIEPGSPPHLAEVIEAADRKIKDYLLRQHLSLWHPISTAPNNQDLELKVLDGVSSVVLPFPCRRTNAGDWINADLETRGDGAIVRRFKELSALSITTATSHERCGPFRHIAPPGARSFRRALWPQT